MTPNHLSAIFRTGKAALFAAWAFLNLNMLHAAGYDESVIPEPGQITLDILGASAGDGDTVNGGSNNFPVSGATQYENFLGADVPDDLVAAKAKVPEFPEPGFQITSVPEAVVVFGVLGVIGFILYRELQGVRALWKALVVRGFSILGSLLSNAYAGTLKAFMPRAKAR